MGGRGQGDAKPASKPAAAKPAAYKADYSRQTVRVMEYITELKHTACLRKYMSSVFKSTYHTSGIQIKLLEFWLFTWRQSELIIISRRVFPVHKRESCGKRKITAVSNSFNCFQLYNLVVQNRENSRVNIHLKKVFYLCIIFVSLEKNGKNITAVSCTNRLVSDIWLDKVATCKAQTLVVYQTVGRTWKPPL